MRAHEPCPARRHAELHILDGKPFVDVHAETVPKHPFGVVFGTTRIRDTLRQSRDRLNSSEPEWMKGAVCPTSDDVQLMIVDGDGQWLDEKSPSAPVDRP